MITIVSLPPNRLADIMEHSLDLIPPFRVASCLYWRQETPPSNLGYDSAPGLLTHSRPVQGSLNFQQPLQSTEIIVTLIDHVPDTGAHVIEATTVGEPTPSGAISKSLWTQKRANKSSLLQQTIATHTATE